MISGLVTVDASIEVRFRVSRSLIPVTVHDGT